MISMLDYRRRFKIRRFLFSKLVAVFLLGVLVLVTQAAWGLYEKSNDASSRRDKANAELSNIIDRNKSLESDIERLSTERGVEEEIRDRFMVAREGEGVIVVRQQEATVGESDVRIVSLEKKSLFDKLIHALGLSE